MVGGDADGDAAVVVTAEAFLDSRHPVPGGLFVALAGEQVDGHDYAESAVAARRRGRAGQPAHRRAHRGRGRPGGRRSGCSPGTCWTGCPGSTVVALTGSQGKTGTKDYLAQVLAAAGETVATAGNYNNEIGVPLTVLRATAGTRYLVVEMGARGVGAHRLPVPDRPPHGGRRAQRRHRPPG